MKPGDPPTRSLRAALFRQVAVLLLVTIGFIGALAFWSAYAQVGRTYDGELVSSASLLHSLMIEELSEGESAATVNLGEAARLLSPEDRTAFDRAARGRMFRVWHEGVLDLTSGEFPVAGAIPPTRSGYRNIEDAGGGWRIYTLLVPEQRLAIEVGERQRLRWRLIAAIAVDIALPLMLLVPAAIGLVWLALGDGLRILRDFSQELQRRSLRDLAAVEPSEWPQELSPLVQSVNQLFARLSHSAGVERRFIDEAAHQLRTPLATIKLQTQLATRTPAGAEREALLSSLKEGVDRAADLGTRLLTLARLDSTVDSGGHCDLSCEARGVIADLAAFAHLRGVALAFAGDAAPVRADPLLLQMLANNLIDNAIRHSAQGTEVEVRVLPGPATHTLIVTDAGPGIAPAERQRVFARFYSGHQGQGGSGLGLAIVAEVIRVLRGSIRLQDRPDGRCGLQVVVALPGYMPVI